MTVVLRWKANSWDKVPLTCRIFGHIWSSGWWGSRPYLRKRGGNVDGIGRKHFYLDCKCWRCDSYSTVARVHGDENE